MVAWVSAPLSGPELSGLERPSSLLSLPTRAGAPSVMGTALLAAALLASAVHAHSDELPPPPDRSQEPQWSESRSVPRPPLPDGAVEVDRATRAADWSAPFCSKWTDECTECWGSALDSRAVCQSRKGACTPSRIRCIDVDWAMAPLYCARIDEECGGTTFQVDEKGARQDASGGGFCPNERYRRAPVDYTCASLRSVYEFCRQQSSEADCKEEGRALSAARPTRERLRTILRQSLSLDPYEAAR